MNNKNKLSLLEQPKISFDDLRMKQSVRTTFKLPEEVINLLGIIAGQLGIKQKSLLDQLTEDSRLLLKLAKEVNITTSNKEKRQAKTFVISRSALQSINEVAQKQKVPRDILVEISIKRLLPIIEGELEKHLKRKKILDRMNQLMEQGEALRTQAKQSLGEDDDMYKMIDNQVQLEKKNITTAQTIIKKGMPMEDW
ncbi:hypothetical protein [Desulforhopalus sp. 52FAK]